MGAASEQLWRRGEALDQLDGAANRLASQGALFQQNTARTLPWRVRLCRLCCCFKQDADAEVREAPLVPEMTEARAAVTAAAGSAVASGARAAVASTLRAPR